MIKKDPIQSKVETLQSTLQQLETYPLPGDLRPVLNSAHQSLQDLARAVGDHREQNRLAALYQVSQALGASLDLDEVLNQVMDAVIGLTGAERGFLVLTEPGSSEWQVRAARNFPTENPSIRNMEISRTVITSVIKSGQGLVTTDAQTDPRFSKRESVMFFSLRSILCAPLRARGQVSGAIYVDNRAQSGLFSRDDLDLLSAFANQAAIAIENARLYTRTDKALAQRVAELETLSRIDRELNANLDLEKVLAITHRWAIEGVQADQAQVLLAPEFSSGEQVVIFPSGAPLLTLEDPLAMEAVRDGFPKQDSSTAIILARLAAPMLHAGKVLGVIAVHRFQSFSASEVQFIGRLANRAASALENARLYQAVQQANQAKSRFVSVVTHELRIPMTSIKGYTDLIRQGAAGPVTEQQTSFLDIVRSNVERMSALVSDLSDISRIETGRLKLELANLNVGQSIEEVLRNLRPKLDEKNQELELDLQPDLPSVESDPNRVIQILNNLVSNAWKYTPPEGKIRISARLQDEFVLVQVSDNGLGISQEDQERLFSQFFRSENPAVREQQGWGLGLNVTKRLVELMGGSIGLNSSLGAGSTFWFTLPVSKASR